MQIDCAVNAHSTTRQYDDVKVSIKSINNKNYFLFGIFSVFYWYKSLTVLWCDIIIKISIDLLFFHQIENKEGYILVKKINQCETLENKLYPKHIS